MTEHGLLAESWRGRLSWHPYTEVLVIAEHGRFVWAVDDCGEPYTLRAGCVERINPAALVYINGRPDD